MCTSYSALSYQPALLPLPSIPFQETRDPHGSRQAVAFMSQRHLQCVGWRRNLFYMIFSVEPKDTSLLLFCCTICHRTHWLISVLLLFKTLSTKWSDSPSCSADSYSPHTTAAPSAVSPGTTRMQLLAAVGVVLCRSCWHCFHLETAASTNSVTTVLTARPLFSLTLSPRTPARGQGFPISCREWRHNCVTSLSLFPVVIKY